MRPGLQGRGALLVTASRLRLPAPPQASPAASITPRLLPTAPGALFVPSVPLGRTPERTGLEETLHLVAETSGEQLASASKQDLEQGELLHSTLEHRLWVAGPSAMLATLFAAGISDIHDAQGAAAALLSIVSAYYFADFTTGVYHWGVDNYGDGSTPVVGSQIAAFQGHHQRPWTITEREPANNLYKVFKPAGFFAALCLAASPWTPAWADIWLASATFLVCMSQQFHAWAHMKKSQLPPVVDALQGMGVLVSRKAHGAHHRAPFEGNYCIVSGAWNDFLDDGGSDHGFFRRLERVVRDATGVEPRCWHEPDYSWAEDREEAA